MATDAKKPLSPPPLGRQTLLDRIVHQDANAAIVLLVAALAAFITANLNVQVGERTLAEWYEWLWHVELGMAIYQTEVTQSLHMWINDGLMAIFFFVVGLEIKRELLVGELASLRRAFLPIAAAIGGMVAPALIYTAFNATGEGAAGWGIPMATDIAFAAGVIGLLSGRVPRSLSVFLVALAIVDDLGAVMVIAIFYTEQISTTALIAGFVILALSWSLARFGIRSAAVYVVLALCVWFAFLQSGVHATVAGVLFAFTIPAGARLNTPLFIERVQTLLERFRDANNHLELQVSERQQGVVRAIERECINVEAPLQRIESKLHPFTAFVIMPLFAFANSGVHVDWANVGSLVVQPVTIGVFLGLLVGKQVGIMLACWLSVKARLADLPARAQWKHVYAISWLAAIGFTMSLFIAQLAFAGGHGAGEPSAHLAEAKIGILTASLTAGIIGILLLFITTRNMPREEVVPH